MRIESIGIFGGSGFVGSRLANDLVEAGFRLKIFTRSRDRARRVWLLPNTDVIETDIYDETNLAEILRGCDAVINLVGILNEKGHDGTGFRVAHTELTRSITKVCLSSGVQRYLHMSALNADPFAPSHYLRTKGEAENAALAAHDDGLPTTVFKPSVMFGPGDSFFSLFDTLLKMSPGILPLACANAVMQPVFVGDVCDAICSTLTNRASFGRRYELGGPDRMSLLECVRYVAQVTGSKKIVMPLGNGLSRLQSYVMEYVPGKPFSKDNFDSLREDSVCHGENGFTEFGIRPRGVSEIVPTYLDDRFERMRYNAMRSAARRDQ